MQTGTNFWRAITPLCQASVKAKDDLAARADFNLEVSMDASSCCCTQTNLTERPMLRENSASSYSWRAFPDQSWLPPGQLSAKDHISLYSIFIFEGWTHCCNFEVSSEHSSAFYCSLLWSFGRKQGFSKFGQLPDSCIYLLIYKC